MKMSLGHAIQDLSKKRRVSVPMGILLGMGLMFVLIALLPFDYFPVAISHRLKHVHSTVTTALDGEALESLRHILPRLNNTNWSMPIPDVVFPDFLQNVSMPFSRGDFPVESEVGQRMYQLGYRAKNPIVMIPGIITSHLELWAGEQCAKKYFRQRMWGSTTMLQSMMTDINCWARHMALNHTTGLDPLMAPDFNRTIRVRPAQGFEATDFFIGGLWVWAPIIEALSELGYDINNMFMASYDWRLSFADLERRDRFWTRLRFQIEALVRMNDAKAVILSHSMGGPAWHYFLHWVTANVHRNWVHDHIKDTVFVAAPLSGVPKTVHALVEKPNVDMMKCFHGKLLAMLLPTWILTTTAPVGAPRIVTAGTTAMPRVRIVTMAVPAIAILGASIAVSRILNFRLERH